MAMGKSEADRTPIRTGDVVVDGDDESGDEAVVVKSPGATADEWRVPGGTVAETNPGYPADDRVVVVVFREQLDEHYPQYTGELPLALCQLNRDGVDYYSFPASRLRRVDRLEPREIDLDEIDPCPYHARNFVADENRAYIAAIRERGRPDPPPIVRDCGDRFELVNGHKRVWASHVAGLESIPCDVHYERDLYAARTWARYHLQGYDERERAVALRRIESHLDSQQAAYIRRVYLEGDDEHGDEDGNEGEAE